MQLGASFSLTFENRDRRGTSEVRGFLSHHKAQGLGLGSCTNALMQKLAQVAVYWSVPSRSPTNSKGTQSGKNLNMPSWISRWQARGYRKLAQTIYRIHPCSLLFENSNSQPSCQQPLTLLTHDLPERGFSEENQQVAMKRDEPTSPFIHFLFAICEVNP